MKDIKSLNTEINCDEEKVELIIEELMEKTEFLCTGDVCGAEANLL